MKPVSSVNRLTLLIYGSAAALLGAIFLGVLWQPVMRALPENDLWWMLPTMSHYIAGQSLWQTMAFLLSPAPLFLGQPVLKAYLWLGLVLWGGSTTHLLVISLAVHLANAVLLYVFSRQLALNRRVSCCAALVYCTFFAHFHAYLWPTAFQHLFAVTTILGLMSLYLHADRLGARHPHARRWFLATLAVAVFASLQRSTVIAPILILAHILLCSNDARERAVRYDRWLPLFVLYAIYPMLALTFVGDPIISKALARVPIHHGLTAAALLAVIVAGLWSVRRLVRLAPHHRHYRLMTRGVPLAAFLIIYAGLSLRDHRQLLLPYNMLLPFIAVLTSFLDPLHKALAIDAVEPYHLIPPQASLWYVLLTVACCIGLWRTAWPARKPLLVLLVAWYALTFVRWHDYTFLLRAPSRYFIYLSPVVAILVAWTLTALVDGLGARGRLTPTAGDLIMAGLVILLCVPNVLAIRLVLFRGKLANTYGIYDDLRAAALIQDDLRARGVTPRPEAIVVQQALPLPLREMESSAPDRPVTDYDTLRTAMAEAFHDPSMRGVLVNVAQPPAGSAVYVVGDARIRTQAGEDIDPFTRLVDRAVARLHERRDVEALALFQRAIATRPFLLRFLLADGALEDLRRITGGSDLRQWTAAIGALQAGTAWHVLPKHERIAATMRQEAFDYLLALVCAAYLEDRAGHAERSRYWLARTRLIDGDPQRWMAEMRGVPAVGANPSMLEFLAQVEAPGAIGAPAPWRMDDYGLERFVARLILHWDIRGAHEMSRQGG